MKSTIRAARVLLAVLCLAAAAAAHALKEDRDQPVQITADTVDMNEKTRVAVYRGHVRMRQGSAEIHADRVEVRLRESENKVETMRVTGNPARLKVRPDDKDEDVHASAREMIYRAIARRVELRGDALLRQGRNELGGEDITYDLDEKRLSATGGKSGGRVHAVLYPKKTEPDARP